MQSLINVNSNRTILIIEEIITVILMAKDKNDKLSDKLSKEITALHVVKMLDGIPEDIADLFTPETEDELKQLELNIIQWLSRIQERQKVMQLQKRHGLPLRPNQSLRDVTIRLRILELKRKRKPKDDGFDSSSDKDNGIW